MSEAKFKEFEGFQTRDFIRIQLEVIWVINGGF
jgi:hypothetical protein